MIYLAMPADPFPGAVVHIDEDADLSNMSEPSSEHLSCAISTSLVEFSSYQFWFGLVTLVSFGLGWVWFSLVWFSCSLV